MVRVNVSSRCQESMSAVKSLVKSNGRQPMSSKACGQHTSVEGQSRSVKQSDVNSANVSVSQSVSRTRTASEVSVRQSQVGSRCWPLLSGPCVAGIMLPFTPSLRSAAPCSAVSPPLAPPSPSRAQNRDHRSRLDVDAGGGALAAGALLPLPASLLLPSA